MLTVESFATATERLASGAKELLRECDELISVKAQELTKLRREYTNARRAVASLSSGTEAMQAIGQTIAEQLDALGEAVESKADELAVLRARRRRLAKAVDHLTAALEEQQAVNAALVRPIVARLMEENDGLTYEEVYGLVRGKIAADQLPLIGLGLQVKRALVDLPLEVDDDGVYRSGEGPNPLHQEPIEETTRTPVTTEGVKLAISPSEEVAS